MVKVVGHGFEGEDVPCKKENEASRSAVLLEEEKFGN